MSSADKVKEMIQAIYQVANIRPIWDGEVNERVAEIFGLMLKETKKCSDAFAWVPTPPAGRATIGWLVIIFSKGMFMHYKSLLSFTCARAVVLKWRSELEMASLGITANRLPLWS